MHDFSLFFFSFITIFNIILFFSYIDLMFDSDWMALFSTRHIYRFEATILSLQKLHVIKGEAAIYISTHRKIYQFILTAV